MPQFLIELKRRHVWRVAIAYIVAAWLLLQLGSIVFPTLHAPSWCEAVLLAFLVLGLPVAVILAWAFEVTPEGVRRTEAADSEAARPAPAHRRVGHTLTVITLVVLAAAVGVLAWQ
ncbi:MAG: tetratricopeptide repeat protein, partial [Gammaproteobacteria bacterium]